MLTSILLHTLLLNIEIVSPNWAPEINPVICYTQTPLSRVCIHFRQLGKVLLKRELFLISSCLSSQTHYWAHFNPKYHHHTPKPSDSCFHPNYLLCFTLSSQCVHHTHFLVRSLFIPWSFLLQTPNWLQWRSSLSPLCLTPAVTQTFCENKLHKIIISIFYLTFSEKHSLTSLLVQGLSMPVLTSSLLIINMDL